MDIKENGKHNILFKGYKIKLINKKKLNLKKW